MMLWLWCSEHGLGDEEHERGERALRLHRPGAQQARLERALHHPDLLSWHRWGGGAFDVRGRHFDVEWKSCNDGFSDNRALDKSANALRGSFPLSLKLGEEGFLLCWQHFVLTDDAWYLNSPGFPPLYRPQAGVAKAKVGLGLDVKH